LGDLQTVRALGGGNLLTLLPVNGAALGLDWNDWKVLVPIVIAFAALACSVVVGSQQVRGARNVAAIYAFRALDDEFNSRPVRCARQRLAQARLNETAPATADLTMILGVLELVGWNVKKKIIRAELAWTGLSGSVLGYWWIFNDEIVAFRKAHSASYFEYLASLITALDKVSKKKKEPGYIGRVPDDFRARFLQDEAGLDRTLP
jgi:hypothetical protein